MVLVGVAREQREPGAVRLADRPSERVLVDVTDGEVLEESAQLGLVHGQRCLRVRWASRPSLGRQGTARSARCSSHPSRSPGPRVRTTRSRGVGEDSPMTETQAATLDDVRGSAGRIAKSIEGVIEGKPEVVRVTLTVLLAEGHLLIEDVPGVGKTMLAKALARSIDCSVKRIQFTPDLLPVGRHRRQRVQPGHPRLRVQARGGLRQHRRGRRDQPGLAEDPVRAPRVHGGAPGHRRRHDLRPGRAVHGDGHPEPGRDGGHLPPPRGAARPVHGAGLHGLPRPRRRARDARPAQRRRRPLDDLDPVDRRGRGRAARRTRSVGCTCPTPSGSTSSTWSARPAARPTSGSGRPPAPRSTWSAPPAPRPHWTTATT